MTDREKEFKERIKCGIAYCEDTTIEEIKQDFKMQEEKNKQIEEMMKDLKEEKLYALINKTSYMRSAENLYEQGYRKIPQDSVVLTREELSKNYVQRELYEHIIKYRCLPPEFGKIVNEVKLQTRKETAEEIFSNLHRLIYSDKTTPIWVKQQLNEIAKQFGVEIKE